MSGPPLSPPDWLSLGENEQVWLRRSPSQNLVLAALVGGMALLLVMSVVVSVMRDLGTGRLVSFTVLLLIVGLLVAAFLIIRRYEYVVTSRRICSGRGLGSKQVTSVDLEEVTDVTVEQSGWQQLVNVGTIQFVTDDGGLAFAFMENPMHVHQQVLQFVEIQP